MTKVFDEPTWAIVELFGHGITAGLISEVSIAGSEFLRVDIPDIVNDPTPTVAFTVTKFYGGGAIYAITPSDEASVLHAIDHMENRPINKWTIPDRPAIPASTEAWPEDEDSDGPPF